MTTRIHILQDSVVNKIAAGEVVERPASVLKELVENALDAGATSIRVTLEEGGRKLISVEDNGSGMSAEDVPLALTRHATSKITHEDDLFQVKSMGFRGEALASIASVSRFSLVTKEADAKDATRLSLVGGEQCELTPWTRAEHGTTVTVEDLFFNVPARAKFLKQPSSEAAACVEVMEALVLARTDCSFRLVHKGREQLAADAVDDSDAYSEAAIRQRVRAVLGVDVEKDLVYVDEANRFGRVRGLVSPPGVERLNAKSMLTFVNGRLVRDKTLRYGALRGYHSHLMRGKYPVIVLYVAMDPTLVDVNVHPAKTEVRFQYPQEVQSLLAQAVRKVIRQGAWAAMGGLHHGTQQPLSSVEHSHLGSSDLPSVNPPSSGGYVSLQGGEASYNKGYRSHSTSRQTFPRSLPMTTQSAAWSQGYQDSQVADFDRGSFVPPVESQPVSMSAVDWGSLHFVGAFNKCFLFFEHGESLLVIDQHAFHERILFERLTRDTALLQRTQRLLVPEALELSGTEVQILKERKAELQQAGFDFRIVQDAMVELTQVPALMVGRDVARAMAEFARGIESTVPVDGSVAGIAQDILATIACHSAVRAGEELGETELKRLLSEAATVDFYHNCPHGRRVFKWWSKSQVGQWFDR